MAPSVCVLVIVTLMLLVGFWWDDRRCAPVVQFGQQPVGVECLVCQQRAK